MQFELLSSQDLSKNVLSCDTIKHEAAYQAWNVWQKRLSFVELKRKFPSLGVKEDEKLLYDEGQGVGAQAFLCRKDWAATIKSQIEWELLISST